MPPNVIVGVFQNWLRILTPDWEYTQRVGEKESTPRFQRTPPRRIFHPGKAAL